MALPAGQGYLSAEENNICYKSYTEGDNKVFERLCVSNTNILEKHERKQQLHTNKKACSPQNKLSTFKNGQTLPESL